MFVVGCYLLFAVHSLVFFARCRWRVVRCVLVVELKNVVRRLLRVAYCVGACWSLLLVVSCSSCHVSCLVLMVCYLWFVGLRCLLFVVVFWLLVVRV